MNHGIVTKPIYKLIISMVKWGWLSMVTDIVILQIYGKYLF